VTFIERIAARTAADPQAVAILDGERAVTYADLWGESGRLADRLSAAGLGPGSRVVLTGARSAAHVISALGVWRSGGAIVAMDPSYSALRLAQMRRATAPAATVHTDGSVERHSDPALPDDSSPLGLGRFRDDCYYIFTSGSTGRPKGIAMPRPVVDNLVAWQLTEFRGLDRPRIAMFAAVSFDVSIQEMCCALASGGCLAVVSEEVRGRPDLLLDWLCANAIEVLFLPYVALQMLAVEAASSPLTRRLRLTEIITGGETLKRTPDIVRMFRRLPGARLVNQYGPSETHVVTSFALTGDPGLWPALPPIGAPIPGVDISLRNADGTKVAPGKLGELCVGGVAVARGYVGQDAVEATARQFRGGYYRTGDFASESDGVLCFAGRRDHQVKISGHRVEPDAVESMLLEHPAVRHAVCLTPGRDALSRTLVAVVVGSVEQAVLRAFLSARLPPPMVPRRFVVVDALPLTASGKVDRLRAAELLSI
jgi:D-alanine--poly(phosphoribitol) ligase subunit 1